MDWSELLNAAAVEARRQQQQYELREREMVKSMQEEMERMHKDHQMAIQDAVQRVQTEAAAKINRLKRDMQQNMQAFEEETIRSAEKEIRSQYEARRESLEAHYQSQREQLAKECELVLQEKDEDMQTRLQSIEQQQQLEMRLELERLEHKHLLEIETLKNEIWNTAQAQIGSDSELMLDKVIAETEDRCKILHDEVQCLRGQLEAKEQELQRSADNMQELDFCFMDVAREINSRHNSDMAQLSNEKLAIERENERLHKALHSTEASNASLKEEIQQLRSKYRAIQLKSLEQDEIARTADQRKNDAVHRAADFQSCKQLLEQQIADLKLENVSLTKALDQKTNAIFELTSDNKELIAKTVSMKSEVGALIDNVDKLEKQCAALKKKCSEAIEHSDELELENRRHAQDNDRRLSQKESQIEHLTKALDAISKETKAKTDPVVVHLHGNQESQKRSVDTSTECHHLRARLLELQRTNYRLESDLMEAKSKTAQVVNKENDSSARQLQLENHSLKQIITMMRKEMEQTVPSPDEELPAEEVSSSYILAMEQQLLQSNAYLDILLRSKDGKGCDDELYFLRSRYRELHEVLDHVRQENLRLQGISSGNFHGEGSMISAREQELIQKLEEATDEIESLAQERNKLLKMIRKDQHETILSPQQFRPNVANGNGNNDKNLMSAVLNDLSKDGESEAASSIGEVRIACFGTRPRSNHAPLVPTKNMARTGGLKDRKTMHRSHNALKTSSSRQTQTSSRKHDRPRIRNWNSKND